MEIATLKSWIAEISSITDTDTLTKAHRDIYTYITSKVLPTSPSVRPPLAVLIYAINNIIRPTFILSQIPDILDLLANVEFYRRLTVTKCKDAIAWNQLYKRRDENVITLTAQEEAKLTWLSTDKRDFNSRVIYRLIILRLCQLDIHRMWISPDEDVASSIPIRLNEYFPALNPRAPKSPRLFHTSFTDEDNADLAETGRKCIRFMQSEMLALNRGTPLNDEDSIDQDQNELIIAIDGYLDKVQECIRRLENIFPDYP